METLGEQFDRISKILKKKQDLDTSQYSIVNRSKHSIDIEYYEKKVQSLLEKISLHGRNYIEGTNTSPIKVNRKARIVTGY